MSLLTSDLNILYSGGSGGFYLLHYLLLFRRHWCALDYPPVLQHIVDHGSQVQKNQLRLSPDGYLDCAGTDWPSYADYNQLYPNIAEPAKSELELLHADWATNGDYIDQGFDTKLKLIISHQWNIQTASKWKQHEVWPLNLKTLTAPSPRPQKIYFTCLSPDSSDWADLPGKKILIYTDIRSQMQLSSIKNANWFNNGKTLSTTQVKKFMRQAFTANGHKIYHRLQPYFDTADQTIYLQDLVTNPEQTLDMPVTEQHKQFTQHWKSCHPLGLLKKLGLN